MIHHDDHDYVTLGQLFRFYQGPLSPSANITNWTIASDHFDFHRRSLKMKNGKSPQRIGSSTRIDDDFETIDRYLREWGIPVQTHYRENIESSLFYKDISYVSLFLIVFTLAKYSIQLISTDRMVNRALSNHFFYYQNANFFFCMVEVIMETSAILQKLLMIYYRGNARKMKWIEIFDRSPTILNDQANERRKNIGLDLKTWCAKNFKKFHYLFLVMTVYFDLWIFITHLIFNDITYVLTIDLLWCLATFYSLFFYTTQAMVGTMLPTLTFIQCNAYLDGLSSYLDDQKIGFDSNQQNSKTRMDVLNILHAHNYFLNFMHECNAYWKNLIGISVLTSILGTGVLLVTFPGLDGGTKFSHIVCISMMMIFFIPFFLLGNVNHKKVCWVSCPSDCEKSFMNILGYKIAKRDGSILIRWDLCWYCYQGSGSNLWTWS